MTQYTNRADFRPARAGVGVALLCMGLLLANGAALADGDENLGIPSIGIESGNGIAIGGVGLQNAGESGIIDVSVPATATIEQVLLYWSGEAKTSEGGADNEVVVDGTDITGMPIGGPSFFYNLVGGSVWATSFRADVTNEGFVSPGDNSVEVSGLHFQVSDFAFESGNHGAALVVIYTDDGPAQDIQIVDGLDLAFCGFDEPRKSMVEKTFVFSPADIDRVAEITMIFGSEGSEDRPHSIVVSDNLGNSFTHENPLVGNSDGDLFTSLMLAVDVPIGAAEITIHPRSESADDSCMPDGDNANASLVWSAAAFALEIPPRCGDGEVDDGEECDDGNDDDTDDCRNDCTSPICGDMRIDEGEECDDGNDVPYDGCTDCKLPYCGDEHVDEDEECDDGNDIDDDGCTDCRLPYCGDGNVDDGEECDDGNDIDGDGCTECLVTDLGCRYTGGLHDTYSNDDEWNYYTAGGQAGANTALQPQPKGEWTHRQHRGTAGRFTFHGGTASAPAGTEVDVIRCSDPGGCSPSGDPPSPVKQLDFDGIGSFRNMGTGRNAPDFTRGNSTASVGRPGKNFEGTYHWFQVNIDDLGEPGNTSSQSGKNPGDGNDETCPESGFGEKGAEEFADCDCSDFYRITIYDGTKAKDIVFNDDGSIDPAQLNQDDVIYEVHGYIDGGNLQLHHLTGFDRK